MHLLACLLTYLRNVVNLVRCAIVSSTGCTTSITPAAMLWAIASLQHI